MDGAIDCIRLKARVETPDGDADLSVHTIHVREKGSAGPAVGEILSASGGKFNAKCYGEHSDEFAAGFPTLAEAAGWVLRRRVYRQKIAETRVHQRPSKIVYDDAVELGAEHD